MCSTKRTTRSHDPTHLQKARIGVGEEVHHKLRDDHVERLIRPGQPFGISLTNVGAGNPVGTSRKQRLRRVSSGDVCSTDAARECFGQGARSAPHIERAHPRLHSDEGDELWGERLGIAAHVAVIRITGHVERHAEN